MLRHALKLTLPTLLTSVLVVATAAIATAEEPFAVTVTSPAAKVFSGAGEQYYATAVLPQGSNLTAYKQEGQFFAVRPPAESFSWVPAADVEFDAGAENPVGTILREGVPSRVGSLLSAGRNVVHVRLQAGEQVQVLSQETVDGVEWLKISPPAGEFRWISQRDVLREGESPVSVSTIVTAPIANPNTANTADTATTEPAALALGVTNDAKPIEFSAAEGPQAAQSTALATSSPGWVQTDKLDTSPVPSNVQLTQATVGSTIEPSAGTQQSASPTQPEATTKTAPRYPWQPIDTAKLSKPAAEATRLPQTQPQLPQALGSATQSASGWATATTAAPTQPVATVPAVLSPPAAGLPAPSVPRSLPLVSAAPPLPARPASSIAAGQPTANRLGALEVELSRRVSEEPGRWSLADLQQEIAQLQQAPTEPATKTALAGFAVRTARFAQIATRYRAARTVAPRVALTKQSSTAPLTAPLTGSQPPATGPQPSTPVSPSTSQYDAVGVLRAVVSSKRPDAPKFALVDPNGKVVTFITPSAGLDLKTLIGKQVGVSGKRGYMPQLRSRHVAATRIAQMPATVR